MKIKCKWIFCIIFLVFITKKKNKNKPKNNLEARNLQCIIMIIKKMKMIIEAFQDISHYKKEKQKPVSKNNSNLKTVYKNSCSISHKINKIQNKIPIFYQQNNNNRRHLIVLSRIILFWG